METVLKTHDEEFILGYVRSGAFLEEGEDTNMVECGFYFGDNIALVVDANMDLRMMTIGPRGKEISPLGKATMVCRDDYGEYAVVALEGDFYQCDLCGEHGSAFAILEDGRRVFIGKT